MLQLFNQNISFVGYDAQIRLDYSNRNEAQHNS